MGFTYKIIFLALLTWTTSLHSAFAREATDPIKWRKWGETVFKDARIANKHILLDLNARWCHWCHFMERRTYRHDSVVRLINDGYVAVRVDQDANPDLASRYGDWGWPATIIFSPDGQEVAKLRGFHRPSLMSAILYTIRNHPERVPQLASLPEIESSSTTDLSDAQRQKLIRLLDKTYDAEFGGWGKPLKFLRPDVLDYALERGRQGDARREAQARQTLDAALGLVDPVWGGIFQYSHERDWSAPHYEKIMAFQGNAIAIYSRAYLQFGDKRYLEAAESIARYLLTRLRGPKGAFFTSQDADVDSTILGEKFYSLDHGQRLELGVVPPIDTHIYARENGWAVTSLLTLYQATGDRAYLNAARSALEWVIKHRSLADGGFKHGEKDRGGPYLSDNLAMARAMLAFYMATGDTVWLQRAVAAGDFIASKFKHSTAGFITTHTPPAQSEAFAKPFLNIEENTRLTRFANLLYRTIGKTRFREMANHAMRYLTSDGVVTQERFMIGVVLAEDELSIEPAHVAIIGAKNDAAAHALHVAAMQLPISYIRIDRLVPGAGPMFNADVTYPKTQRGAAFACANQICSLPVFEPEKLGVVVDRMMAKRSRKR